MIRYVRVGQQHSIEQAGRQSRQEGLILQQGGLEGRQAGREEAYTTAGRAWLKPIRQEGRWMIRCSVTVLLFQLEIISHLGQPSCFHCGAITFQSLC